MCSEDDKKRKRKKGRATDDLGAEKPPETLSDDVNATEKKKKKAKRIEQAEAAVSQILPEDDRKGEKKKKKKRRKTEATGGTEHAVLAEAQKLPSGWAEASPGPQGIQPHSTNNKQEAEDIRARLGISAADPKSAQKRKSFQFSFSLPQPIEPGETDTAAVEKHDDAVVSVEVQQKPAAEPEQAEHENVQPEEHVAEEPEQEQLPGPPRNTMQDFVPRRVYVGGMPFWYTEEQIRECWGECGDIQSLTMLTFPDSGNFRGLVFITFVTEEAYNAALDFNGDELEGKYLVVKPCRAAGGTTALPSRQENGSRGRSDENTATTGKQAGASSSKTGRSTWQAKSPSKGAQKAGKKFDKEPERVKDYNVLFVGNVPWELTRSSVSDLFREFKPKFVRMFDKPGTRQHKGFAHIHFADEASVDKALSMNGASIMGRKIVVMYAQPTKEVKKKPTQDLIEDGI